MSNLIGFTGHFIVLIGSSLLPNALLLFLDLLCSPEFSLKSQTRNLSLKSLPEDLCSGVYLLKKINRPKPDLNPRTLALKASTLPRDHRVRCPGKYVEAFSSPISRITPSLSLTSFVLHSPHLSYWAVLAFLELLMRGQKTLM